MPKLAATGREVKAKVARHRPLLTADELRAEERRYATEGYQIVPGTLRNRGEDLLNEPKFKNKRSIVIACGKRGCGVERRTATSDLHQVRFCLPHTLEARAARKNENRRKAQKTDKEANEISRGPAAQSMVAGPS